MSEASTPRPVPGPPRPGPRPGESAPTSAGEPAPSAGPLADPAAPSADAFADLTKRPVAEHVAAFETEHARLERELGTIDQL